MPADFARRIREGEMTALRLYRPGHSHFRVRVVYGCSERDMTNDEYTQLIAFLSAQFTKVDGRFRIVDASLAQIRSEIHEFRDEVDRRFRKVDAKIDARVGELKGLIGLSCADLDRPGAPARGGMTEHPEAAGLSRYPAAGARDAGADRPDHARHVLRRRLSRAHRGNGGLHPAPRRGAMTRA
mgnify:FL=1